MKLEVKNSKANPINDFFIIGLLFTVPRPDRQFGDMLAGKLIPHATQRMVEAINGLLGSGTLAEIAQADRGVAAAIADFEDLDLFTRDFLESLCFHKA